MQVFIRVFILCFVSGALASTINILCNKDKFHICNIIKTFAFYAIMFYIMLSLFQTLLGYGMSNLTDAFGGVSWRTYLRYSLPLMIISVVMPLLIKKILGEKVTDFINLALSVMIGIYAVVYLIIGKSNNLMNVCIASIGMILSLLIVFCYKKEVLYCTRQNVKERLKFAVPTVLFWIITMVLFLPNELYLSNVNDMEVPYGLFNRTLILGALVYFAVYTILLVFFLGERQFSLVCEIIFAITASCYLQGAVLNGEIYVMDGNRQTWSTLTVVINAIIWLVFIGIVISLKYIIRKNVDKAYSMICIYLSIIQLITWGYMGFSTELPDREADFELTTNGRFELSPDHNVIVFILDWYDAQIMDKILEEDDTFLEPLKDFTWYKNMTSLYAFTSMSVPYLLSDVEWQYDMEEKEYREYAFQNKSLLRDIAEQNYDVGIYTSKTLVSGSAAHLAINYSNNTGEGWNRRGIFEQMVKCSKYKSYPFALKSEYWYTGDQLSGGVHVYDAGNDDLYYNELIETGIQVKKPDKYNGTYRLYHLRGAHPPFAPDMTLQGKWCMNIVYEYLEQLKEAGLYDEATIIITADHGHNYFGELFENRLTEYGLDYASRPILFVKKSYQTNDNGVYISMAPVSHAQLGATVMEAVCGDTLGHGEAVDDIEEDRQYERYFILRRHDDIPYIKYAINGYSGDWNNWSIVTENE